jgi:hypothetical protein
MRRAMLTLLTAGALALTATTGASAAPQQAPGKRPSGIAAVRQATKSYQDLQRAEDAGYELFTDAKGIACIDMPKMGGMGVHFVKSALVGNPSERIRHPEALVYRIGKHGMLRLAAVEYVVLAKAWKAGHPHTAPRLFGHKFMYTKAGNRYGLPAYYSLHAWAWYHNPAGMFAPFNPRVTC